MAVSIADRKPLNAVKYVAKDFPSYFDSLMRRLKVEYGTAYSDFASTTQGVALIDLMANAMGQLSWYMDRVVSDCYLDTARTRAAVSRIVKQLAYKMRPASAATVDLVLTFTPAVPAPAQLQAGFRFAGPNGLEFESIAPTFLATGTTTVTVACREGSTRLLTYTGSGLQNQIFRLNGASEKEGTWIAVDSVRLWVDGAEWTENPFLSFEKTNQFQCDYLDDPPVVLCGDGVAGNIPDSGSDVKVQYVIVHGENGMVSANTITSAISQLVVGGDVVAIACTNPDGSSGGAPPETADEARKLAPYAFAARDAAITQSDYQTLVNGFSDPLYGRVAKGYAINVRSAVEDSMLEGYCRTIEDLLTAYVTTMTAIEGTSVTDAEDALAEAVVLLGQITAITTLRTSTLTPLVASVRSRALALQTEMTAGVSKSASMQTTLTALQAYVTANYSTNTTLMGYVTTLSSQATEMRSSFANGLSIATQVGQDGYSLDRGMNDTTAGITSLVNLETAVRASCVTLNNLLNDLVAVITGITGLSQALSMAILGVVEDIQIHTSLLFDADCKANYVQVPIVTINGSGDYVSPASGLIYGLQAYLESRKEVTQLVQVVDGSDMLVPTNVTIEVGVLEGYVVADVLADVYQTVLEILRGRDFNQPLYINAMHKAITAATHGIDFANVSFATPGHLLVDAHGNVITPASYIITRGTVAVTEVL
jgi:hypothetical protein